MSESNEVVEGAPIKNKKALRYYYRHREEIKEKRVEKLMEGHTQPDGFAFP